MPKDDDIVIVGVGCKFPGANNLKEFWRVLSKGENHVKEIPKERWNVDAFYDPDPDAPGKTYVRKAGFVESIDEWDHECYGINATEAGLVDPQQRLVLDCVHMALEDGGITKKNIENTDTAVYIGSMTDDYKGHVLDNTLGSAYSVTGTHNSIISARVAYVYNLHGPALTIDTACSSSLVAIDLASQAIATGKCSTAICGGVNVLLDPQVFVALAKARMLSPTGQCQTFSANADGYARGEGCGIVILKTLKDALRDGNKIWGSIKTGTNQDGKMAQPITAPAEEQQKNLIEQLYRNVGVDKGCISLIEAHGTGTPIGDPTEVKALRAHFGKSSQAPSHVFVGAVKTNIGHQEAAAGVAGLIKVLLMMKHETVVPSLWYTKENENPKLKLSEHGFHVPTECMPWKVVDKKERLACVNSFGFGGTNAHAIVEQYFDNQDITLSTTNNTLRNRIVTISAFDHSGLVHNAQVLCDSLDELENCDLDALSYTSTCRRDHRPKRKAIHGTTLEEIKISCRSYLSAPEFPSSSSSKHVVFVYCGVGTAWNGMCASLMQLPVFHRAIDEIDIHLQPLTGWKIADKFHSTSDFLTDPFLSHLAIFACQVGLTAMWKAFGVQPVSVLGQSVGEVAAAFAAGFLTTKDAVKIIYLRSQLLARVKKGRMAVVRNIDTKLVQQHCEDIGSINVAVFTSDTSCTVSGDESSLTKLRCILKSTDAEMINLDVKCAYHSQFVRQAAEQLATQLAYIEKLSGDIPMFSTVTGEKEENGIFSTPLYWKENVEKPVAFSSAIKSSANKNDNVIFLEIGPSPVLKAHIDRILTNQNKSSVLPSLRKNDDSKILAETICKLYELGFDLNWNEITPQVKHMTDVPVYQRHIYKQLHMSAAAIMKMQGVESLRSSHLYIQHSATKDNRAHYSITIDEKTTPFVFQHTVNGVFIVPGATYADIGFEIGRFVCGMSASEVSVSLEFLRPVKVDKGIKSTLDVSTVTQKDETMFHVKQDQIAMCKGWVRSINSDDNSVRMINVDKLKVAIMRRTCKTMYEEEMYEHLKSMKFQHGPSFRMMKQCLTNEIESLTEMSVPVDVLNNVNKTTIHACILDAMIQTTFNATTDEELALVKKESLLFIPVAIGELRLIQRPERKMFAYTRRINTTVLETACQIHHNVLLFNSNGNVIADMRNYTTYCKRSQSIAPCELRYLLTWQPIDTTEVEIKEVAVPNVLVLTNYYKKITEDLFTEYEQVSLCQPGNVENDVFIQNAFTANQQNYDAVILLIHEFIQTSDINCNTAIELSRVIKHNCWLLTDLVRYMAKNEIAIPLYVVTQNTQCTISFESPVMNLSGEELWGFVRSIQMELIYGPITLVDVRPSIKETRDVLLKVVYDTYQNIRTLKPELMIEYDKVYGGQFTKDQRYHLNPSLRTEYTLPMKVNMPHKVMTKRSNGNTLLCFVEDNIHLDKESTDNVNVCVKSVFQHPISMFPRTKEGMEQDQDIWEESMNEGYQLFGLEYTGYPLIPRKKSTCRTPRVYDETTHFENEWEYVCIWPTSIKSTMTIPKGNIVNVKELGGHYEPGLLLHAVISWFLVEKVPKKASVIIFSNSPNSTPTNILADMLRTRKQARIIVPNTDMARMDIDVLISLERFDSIFLASKYCQEIICLEGNIPEALLIEMTRSDRKPNVTTFDVLSLLQGKVSKKLPKIVSWLQKFKQGSNIGNERFSLDNTTNICKDLDLMKTGELKLPIRRPLNGLFKSSDIYIITGGLSGLGWEMTKLLADMGAGIIVTLSRSQVSSQKLSEINDIESKTNCRIMGISADVTKYESVHSAIEEIRSKVKHSDIKGVFHCAGVLNSKNISALEDGHIETVLNPKVIGTINMHIATRDFDLEYFVVSSSINSLIGSHGQSSYGAANCFMDTFIEWRRGRGLPGQSINWGGLSVGMATRDTFIENMKSRGFNLLSVLEIRSCLQEVLMTNRTSIVYTNVDWDIAAKEYAKPSMARQKLQMDILFEQTLSSVIEHENDLALSVPFDVIALKASGEEVQRQALHHVVDVILSKVIIGDTKNIDRKSTLDEIGFDSMSKVMFINFVHKITGHRMATKSMADSSLTYDDLIEDIFNGLFVPSDVSMAIEEGTETITPEHVEK